MIDDISDAIPSRTGSPDPADYANSSRNPDDWELGTGPMTEAQSEYLKALCEVTGSEFNGSLSKAAADEEIDRLRDEMPQAASSPAAWTRARTHRHN